MWDTLEEEADENSFYLPVYREENQGYRGYIQNEDTGISVWVVPSIMTVRNLEYLMKYSK